MVSQVSGTPRRAASVRGKMVMVVLEDGVGVDLCIFPTRPDGGGMQKKSSAEACSEHVDNGQDWANNVF